MSTSIPALRFERKRLERFHKKCVAQCSGPDQFRKRFDVNVKHIAMGALKNPMRRSINNEDMAAVIQSGLLVIDKCTIGSRVRIVVDGKFTNFEWANLEADPITTSVEAAVVVRVVIQETGKTKDFIVTTYVMREDEVQHSSEIPEVTREIW